LVAATRAYYVYIMASFARTLYTGTTNDLERRVFEHREKLVPGFTGKYNVNRLVFYESFETAVGGDRGGEAD
jgi:putative endonuclease